MQRICAAGPVTRGIDIYHGNHLVSAPQLKQGGIDYAFLKATEGLSYVDSSFASRWATLKSVGLIRGAYHFFHPSKGAIQQANFFANVVGPHLEAGDMPCAVDWESTDGVPALADTINAMTFIKEVERITGKRVIIYSGPYFLSLLPGLSPAFEAHPLWVSNYGVSCPSVPSPWKNWTFWQGGQRSNIPGMYGPCDTDVFNGTLAQLQEFVVKSSL